MAKAGITRRIRFAHVAKDAEMYEIWPSYDNIRIVKKNGTVSYSPASVSLTVFRIVGTGRSVLDIPAAGDSEYSIYCTFSSGLKRRISSLSILQSSQYVRYAPLRFDLVRTSSGATYGNGDILACCTVGVIQDGEDGSNAAFTSVVFRRQDDNPGTPSGGSYADPIPPGWSDAPESGTEMLWVSRAKITPDMDGSTEAKSPVWSAPSPCADSTDVEFLWSSHETPGNPTEGVHPYEGASINANWTKSSTGAVWMAVALKSNGKWQEWRTAKVKGEEGKKGDDASVYTAIPNVTAVHYNPNTKTFTGNNIKLRVMRQTGDNTPVDISSALLDADNNFKNAYGISLTCDNYTDSEDLILYGVSFARDDFPVNIQLRRNGKTIQHLTIPLVEDGKNGAEGDTGDTGPAGPYVPPPMKWEDYPSDYRFENGDATCTRLDVVLMEGTISGRQGLVAYKCLRPHPKDSRAKPGVSDFFWTPADAGVYEMVATRVLLAQNAYIDFLSGRGVRVYRDNGTVMATMEGGGTPLYIGGETPSASPFRVNEQGKMFSTDADISGRVRATSGYIGNLEIKGNDLVGYDSNGVQRVCIGVGSVPKVDDVFETRTIDFSITASGNVHCTQPGDRTQASAYIEAGFSLDRETGTTIISELHFSTPAVVGFRLDRTATGLYIGHISPWVETTDGSIPNLDQETTVNASASLYRISGSSRVLIGNYSDLQLQGNEDIEIEGEFPAAKYELHLNGGISQTAFGPSDYWSGRFGIDLNLVRATFLNDANDVSGQTIIAADGFISIQSNTRYARFTMDGGFETRYGKHGFRVGADGIQKLNASGNWVACNI